MSYRYASSSRQFTYRSDTPIDNDTIARVAPSVLATTPHSSRGDRYAFIPTIEVLDGLRANGFQPFEVRQTKTRDASKREFTRHLVRMRHPDAAGNEQEVPEIILLNSHDGSSSYQLLAGFFRSVCSNGLIAGTVCNDVRIRHSGNVVDNVIEGSFTVLDNINAAAERIEQFKAISVSHAEANAFASAALQLRWEPNEAPITPDKVLTARRWDDRKDDLWTTFNRVQENLLRGGLRGRTKTGRRASTRAVTGVTEDVRLNRSLWTLADHFAQLKTGAPALEAAA